MLIPVSGKEMQSVVHQQPSFFFAEGIQKLVYRRDNCENEFGQYLEK